MDVLLASPRGFCAGVKRAIEIVSTALRAHSPPVYVRKEIVHNRFVVESLKQQGAVFVEELPEIPEGAIVIFSAHGIPPSVRAEARRRNLHCIDATCPLVTKVHEEVRRFVSEGYDVLLIGHDGHDEVIGTMGEAPERITLITRREDAESVKVREPRKVIVLTQTTLSMDDTSGIMGCLRNRFPELRIPPSDDICYATRNRQQAVKAIAARAGLILVVGAQNSSNSIRLREVASDAGARAHLINHVAELDWSWLDSVPVVGVTAGASAPESIVQELTNNIVNRFGGQVREICAVRETVDFELPTDLETEIRPRKGMAGARPSRSRPSRKPG